MTDSRQNDSVWQAAVEWVLRVHERPLDAQAQAALTAWLDQDPAHHRAAYDEAARVWLLTGLVPPSGDDGGHSPV